MTRIIETDADRLLELIEEKRNLTAKEAAKILNVKEQQIRKWADILEKNKLIKIRLNFLSMDLFSKRVSDDEIKKQKKLL